ncbi:MAG TPA: HAMP domain-containing sensor histidine kinase [Thermomicrobiales bacterium]|nr:HAMP domain-containing sensor histidine kinase [Thermomicrobiales bacterium]
MSVLRRVKYKLLYLITTPYRLFRQRTIVQLMVSHVAVVLLTFLLLNVFAVAVLVGWLPGRTLIGFETASQDFFLGERTRSLALWIDTDDVVEQYGALDTPEARAELDRVLEMIVNNEVPGYITDHASNLASGGIIAFGVPEAAVITDDAGTILATSDPTLGAVGQPASTITNGATRSAILDAVSAGERSDNPENVGVTVQVSGDITSAAAPIFNEDEGIDGYLVFKGYPLPVIFEQARGEILRDTILAVLQTSGIYAIPAILVALPFAYWQSRTTSRRLERLANLADAFADGDLHTRIRVSRRDEIGRLAERFNEMGSRIEQEARSRRAFLSNVSHELRTPVAVIQGTIERLQDKRCETPEEAEQAVALVNLETHNLTRLIDDLSTLGRLEEAKLRLDLQSTDAHEIVDMAVNGLKNMAWTQRKVSVENIVPTDLPAVFADPGRLRQVVHNLLFNALRHTPEGGLVVVQGAVGGDMVEISVSDTGIGIPPEKLKEIFNRYYQVEMAKRVREGSGLGLHIVQQLVEAQGGTISVDSTVGKGTTFRFTVPLAPKQSHRTPLRLARRDPA